MRIPAKLRDCLKWPDVVCHLCTQLTHPSRQTQQGFVHPQQAVSCNSVSIADNAACAVLSSITKVDDGIQVNLAADPFGVCAANLTLAASSPQLGHHLSIRPIVSVSFAFESAGDCHCSFVGSKRMLTELGDLASGHSSTQQAIQVPTEGYDLSGVELFLIQLMSRLCTCMTHRCSSSLCSLLQTF